MTVTDVKVNIIRKIKIQSLSTLFAAKDTTMAEIFLLIMFCFVWLLNFNFVILPLRQISQKLFILYN
jgi:hypothetical protein